MTNDYPTENNPITRVNDQTTVALPLRNIITLLAVAGGLVWGYFSLTERLNQLASTVKLLQINVDQNSEFRVLWPRGQLGSLPADAEQFMLIKQMETQLLKLQTQIETGNAPADQQQTLRLEFFEDRLTRVEELLGRNGYGSK
tara:strand:+ start:16 stop:444 length:429 start_codon:yes stop_codon:yes gene_type:complete